jgi:hypothetical protein
MARDNTEGEARLLVCILSGLILLVLYLIELAHTL